MGKYLQDEYIQLRVCESRSVSLHDHDFLELAYVAEGCAEHTVQNRKTLIKKGNYFIVDYNTAHGYRSVGDRPLVLINCLFTPRLIDNSLLYCRSFSALLQHYLIKIDLADLSIDPSKTLFFDEDQRVLSCLQKLLCEYQEKKPGFTEMMRSIFIEMLLITMRKISRDERSTDIVSYLTHRVAAHYAEPLTLSALARKKGYSLPYLSALFKERMGMGFQEYLIRVRIEEACRLLANTDKKISDIAADVGYADTNSFYAAFRRIMGRSPRECRREMRA